MIALPALQTDSRPPLEAIDGTRRNSASSKSRPRSPRARPALARD